MATTLNFNDVVEFTVHGLMQGQAVDNRFHYRISALGGTPTMEGLFGSFKFKWRDAVIPFVSDQYSVRTWEARRLSALLRVGPPNVPTIGRLRYDAQYEENADVADVGQINTAPFPTFTVASFSRKSAGVSTIRYSDDPFPADLAAAEKTFKSSWGLSGMLEEQTDVLTPNVWNAQALSDMDDTGTEMMTMAYVSGANTAVGTEVILSRIREGFARIGAVPTDTKLVYATQDIASVTMDLVVSTRRSRKQRRAGA